MKPGMRAVVPSPATAAAEGVAPAAAANTQPTLTPPAIGALVVNALPARGILGRVVLRGTPPPEQVISMDPSCGKIHVGKATTRFFAVAANGGLADVFVSVTELPRGQWEPPAKPVEIRQRGCEYLPYVSAAQAGQIIRVFNDDPLMHNVHPAPTVEGNEEQNRVQINAGAPPLDHSFPKPELFLRFKCDVHPWMFAYMSIVEHPFFGVSAADGQFALPEPPPGDYTLRFIHRKAGEKFVAVSVRPGRRVVVNVILNISDPLKHEAVVTEE
ncbi:MAG: carboxypeptidase regulatory-like domain-containing protein [Limisphaerales bacterium]